MEKKLFLVQILTWVMILLQIHGSKSCIEKERKGLLELKAYLLLLGDKLPDPAFDTWTNDTMSDCCRWKRVKCNRTSRLVIDLALHVLVENKKSFLNLAFLYPFEELRSLDLSESRFRGFSASFVEGIPGFSQIQQHRHIASSSMMHTLVDKIFFLQVREV